MTNPISGHGPAGAGARQSRPTSSSLANAKPPLTFSRREAPSAAQMEGKRTLGDAQLKEMGAEIIRLYQAKVIDTGGRRIAVKSDDGEWSVRGGSVENLVIHTKDGLIQLRADGMPMRNAAVPIRSWESLEVGLKRALETLRDVERPQASQPASTPA